MKLLVKSIALLLAMISAFGVLTACKKEEEKGAHLAIVANGASDYCIVYAKGDEGGKANAKLLQSELKDEFDVELPLIDDSKSATEKEILVGETARPATEAVKRNTRAFDSKATIVGESLVLFGWTGDTTQKICTYFMGNLIDENGDVYGEGELHVIAKKYGVTALSLFERPIGEYTVVYREDDTEAAKLVANFAKAVEQNGGYHLITEAYTGSTYKATGAVLEVVAKDTGLTNAEYALSTSGDKTVLKVGSEIVSEVLYDQFCTEYLPQSSKGEVSISIATTTAKSIEHLAPDYFKETIRVATFNVPNSIDGNGDLTNFTARQDAYAATVLKYMPDFVCLQESSSTNRLTQAMKDAGYKRTATYLKSRSPKETAAGETVSNMGSSYNCYTPILYRADKWEVVEWDAFLFYHGDRYKYTNTKSAAWAVFKNKEDGQLILVMSTHFALMTDGYRAKPEYANCTDAKDGKTWRYGNAQDILTAFEKVRKKYPNILTVIGGDMNAQKSEQAIQLIENGTENAAELETKNILSDSYGITPENRRTDVGSFHGIYGNPVSNKRIDHIFVSDDVGRPMFHHIVTDDDGMKASDHCMVFTDIVRR